MDSAVARVFNTPELLEAILLEVEIRTLLLSQRTSKAFRATIEGSINLQRALYFEQDRQSDVHIGSKSSTDRNPLFSERHFDGLRIPDLPPTVVRIDHVHFLINFELYGWRARRPIVAGDESASWRRMHLHRVPQTMPLRAWQYTDPPYKDLPRFKASQEWGERGGTVWELLQEIVVAYRHKNSGKDWRQMVKAADTEAKILEH